MMGKTNRLFVLFFCAAALCLCVSCQKRTDVQENAYIYCINNSMSGLVKVACDIPEGTQQDAAEAVLKALSLPSEKMKYLPAIPAQVMVQECYVDHDIVHVDFSKEYKELSVLQELLTRAAVVQSLLQIETINGVKFTVNNEIITDSEKKMIGLMNSDDFVQNVGASPSSYQTDTLTLYFANETGDRLVEQQMDVKYSSNISQEKLIVEKLMGGPKKSGANPVLNSAATLLSVTIKDGICYVNFDSEFLNSPYDIMPEVTIYALVNSLIQGTSAEKVQITVNGEKNVIYKDTIDLSQPFELHAEWIQGAEGTTETEDVQTE